MSDTLALARLCFQRSRTLLLVGFALLIGLHGLVFVSFLDSEILGGSLVSDDMKDLLIPIYALGTIPLCLLTMALFDTGMSADLNQGNSGYSSWLIRTPVAAWKLALVPLALKAAWVALVWSFFAFTCAVFLQIPNIVLFPLPALALISIATWVCYLAWRPFRGLWPRLILGTALMLGGYIGMVFSIGVTVGIEDWEVNETWLRALTSLSWIAILASGVWSCVRAVKLARMNIGGIISESNRDRFFTRIFTPESRKNFSLSYLPTISLGVIPTSRALINMEASRSRVYLYRAVVFGWLPCILICAFLVPLHFSTVLLLFIAAVCIATMTTVQSAYRDGPKSGPLMSWIASSPISSANLAWSRLAGAARTWTLLFGGVLVVFVAWSFRPFNQMRWHEFDGAMAARYGDSSSGLRLAIATVLVAYLAYVSYPLRSSWVDMLGKIWVTVVYSVSLGMVPLVLIGAASRFMWRQKSWESAASEALGYAEYLPTIGVCLLVAKLLAVLATSITLVRASTGRAEGPGDHVSGVGVSRHRAGSGDFRIDRRALDDVSLHDTFFRLADSVADRFGRSDCTGKQPSSVLMCHRIDATGRDS